jgi:hypothetical protein
LTKALVANGYSISQINKAFHLARNSKSKNTPYSSSPLAHISLPYIQGTNIKKIGQKEYQNRFQTM